MSGGRLDRRNVALVVTLAVITIVISAILLGAAGPVDEVLSVEAASRVSGLSSSDSASGQRYPAYVCIAVTSPTRGPVTQLESGNVHITDAIRGPQGLEKDAGHMVEVQSFRNQGRGFYVLELLPTAAWVPDDYMVQIEVTCPWGTGITVHTLHLSLAWVWGD